MVAERKHYSPQLTTAMQKVRRMDGYDLQESEILSRLDELFGEIKAGLKSGNYPPFLQETFHYLTRHSFAAARLLALGLWDLQAQQERDEILIHGTNEIETPPMRALFEISTMAREMIESEYPATRDSGNLFQTQTKPEIYNGFMDRLERIYQSDLRQRGGALIRQKIAQRRRVYTRV